MQSSESSQIFLLTASYKKASDVPKDILRAWEKQLVENANNEDLWKELRVISSVGDYVRISSKIEQLKKVRTYSAYFLETYWHAICLSKFAGKYVIDWGLASFMSCR